jgi:hypothetical protein
MLLNIVRIETIQGTLVKRPLYRQYGCLLLLHLISIMQYDSLWTTQYYCAIFYFVLETGLVDVLSDTDAACVATITLALCL